MEKKIAVLSDVQGAPTTLTLAESVIVYERGEEEWQENASFSCMPFGADTPKDLRILGEAISSALCDVKVILGSEISGVSYSALNRVGFLICESQGIGDEFFDDLFRELDADDDVMNIEKSKSGSSPSQNLVNPQPTTQPGHYFINLQEVQQRNPLLSTKKILRPFLKGTLFLELVVLCSHVPPWLDTDLPKWGLAMTVKTTDTNSCVVRIMNRRCEA